MSKLQELVKDREACILQSMESMSLTWLSSWKSTTKSSSYILEELNPYQALGCGFARHLSCHPMNCDWHHPFFTDQEIIGLEEPGDPSRTQSMWEVVLVCMALALSPLSVTTEPTQTGTDGQRSHQSYCGHN